MASDLLPVLSLHISTKVLVRSVKYRRITEDATTQIICVLDIKKATILRIVYQFHNSHVPNLYLSTVISPNYPPQSVSLSPYSHRHSAT